MTRLVQRPLTNEELKQVLVVILNCETTIDVATLPMIHIYRLLLPDIGQDWDTCTTLNPSDFAIPQEQSSLILQRMIDRDRGLPKSSEERAVQVGMEWINRGPSSYEDDPEPTCDICGVGQYHSTDQAWNGETGNHVECESLTCLNDADGGCDGPVQYRMALSGTGRSFPRCDKHWDERLDEQDRINERYPVRQPADFDPMYAGESWDEEY